MNKGNAIHEYDQHIKYTLGNNSDNGDTSFPVLDFNEGIRVVVENNFCHGFVLEDIDSYFKEKNQIIRVIKYISCDSNLQLFKYVNYTNTIQIRLAPEQEEFEFVKFKEGFEKEKRFAIVKIGTDLFLFIHFSCKYAQKAISIDSDFILVRVSDIQSQEVLSFIMSQVKSTVNKDSNGNDKYSIMIKKLTQEVMIKRMRDDEYTKAFIEYQVSQLISNEHNDRLLKYKIMVSKLDEEYKECERQNRSKQDELVQLNKQNDHLISHVSKYRIPFPKLTQGKKKKINSFHTLIKCKGESCEILNQKIVDTGYLLDINKQSGTLISNEDTKEIMKCPLCRMNNRNCVLHNCGHVPYCLECFEREYAVYKNIKQSNKKKTVSNRIMTKEIFYCSICEKPNSNYSQIYFE